MRALGMSEMQANSRQVNGGDLDRQHARGRACTSASAWGSRSTTHWQFQLSHSTIEALEFGFGLNVGSSIGVYDMGDTTLTSIGVNYHW